METESGEYTVILTHHIASCRILTQAKDPRKLRMHARLSLLPTQQNPSFRERTDFQQSDPILIQPSGKCRIKPFGAEKKGEKVCDATTRCLETVGSAS